MLLFSQALKPVPSPAEQLATTTASCIPMTAIHMLFLLAGHSFSTMLQMAAR